MRFLSSPLEGCIYFCFFFKTLFTASLIALTLMPYFFLRLQFTASSLRAAQDKLLVFDFPLNNSLDGFLNLSYRHSILL